MACDSILQTFKIDALKELERKTLQALEKLFSSEEIVMIYVLRHCNHVVIIIKHGMVSEVVDLKHSLNYKIYLKMSAFKPPSTLSLEGNVAYN